MQSFNLDPNSKNLVNLFYIQRGIRDKKKRAEQEEKIEYQCYRQYCSFCLKAYYDLLIGDVQAQEEWLCPCCVGQCFCSRCMRQEEINKIKTYYCSLNVDKLQKCRPHFEDAFVFDLNEHNFFD